MKILIPEISNWRLDWLCNADMREAIQSPRPHKVRSFNPCNCAFTLVELLVVVGCVALLTAMLLPAIAGAKPSATAAVCLRNLKQLSAAWAMYAHDSRDILLASDTLPSNPFGRIIWFNGGEDWSPNNPSNWDINRDMVKSPIWRYANQDSSVFKCPEDKSTILVSGANIPRVRGYSMNNAFGTGEWLDKSYNQSQTVWRIYQKTTDIMVPAKTFLFADEHPNSINDAALMVACTGAQPGDPDSSAQLIDWPASYHYDGACGFSFADGRAEIHRWKGTYIKHSIAYGSNNYIPLNIPAGDSAVDIRWLAANTSIKR
jgi:type II secretory pathway pseudopilin PulG